MEPAFAWQHTIYAYPILLAAAISLALAAYALRYRRGIDGHPVTPGDDSVLLTFAAMNVAIAVWTGFSALKLLSADVGVQFHAYRLLYFGSSSVGPLLLLFVLAYTGRTRWLRPRFIAGLFAVPVVFWLLLFWNPSGIVIAGTHVVDVDGLVVLRTTTGPAHVALSFTYAALIALVTLTLVGIEGVRRGRTYLPQTALLVVAIITPIATSALTSAAVPPFTVDAVNYVPISTVVSSLALGVATVRYRVLDLRPIAYRAVIDDTPDGILVLDASGRVVHANPTVSSLLGEEAPTIGDRPEQGPLATAISGAAAPNGGKEIASARDTGGRTDERTDAMEVEETIRTTVELPAGGDAEFLEVRSRPLRRRGRHLGQVIVLRDVTVQKRREQDLEAFTGVISHDLRAPLRTTERYLGALQRQVGDDLDEEAEMLLSVARANSRRGHEMVTDLLAYSRIGIEDEPTEPVDCDRLVGEVLDALRYRIDECEATVAIEDLPTVHGVEHLLRRLLQNLIANAVEHAGPAPTVTLSATREGSMWRIVVRDDGVGIDPRELQYAAEPFTRGADVDRDAGTGMGLAICERIVVRHGGELTIDSTPGSGTTVAFTLPAVPEPPDEDR
ncbi:histidine kinase N-terminal 7TM domain-containing protein [Halorubrum vacuolatum]|uniref:histidine kinase n=1 Tax=Halorubrum vacuolatum TaxID=63740 RepID=A0A238VKK4_HALVU|nr:histidine kinase N-terminal 7TM domain-containing protein [Halorubrum vacuolatum]SNR34637.1 His Kinase A (phospho-acceptor) domain-containing protein [Halorubrum vacuolatum]